jgi:hypothetical protein
MARYKGRHRAPSTTGKTVARFAIAGVSAAVPMGVFAAPATAATPHPDIEAAIIACESGGNPTAKNTSSTASGLYQFINGTWLAYGGGQFAPRAASASPAEQRTIFLKAFAAAGTTPWNASKSCWSGKAPKHSSPKVAPQSGKPKHAKPVTSGRAADGSGTYTCDVAHLYFEACDPGNIGEVVNYPRYRK